MKGVSLWCSHLKQRQSLPVCYTQALWQLGQVAPSCPGSNPRTHGCAASLGKESYSWGREGVWITWCLDRAERRRKGMAGGGGIWAVGPGTWAAPGGWRMLEVDFALPLLITCRHSCPVKQILDLWSCTSVSVLGVYEWVCWVCMGECVLLLLC